jgi:hypothetical protein
VRRYSRCCSGGGWDSTEGAGTVLGGLGQYCLLNHIIRNEF